jgi:HAD superfamily hydrolase (TIGR01484 family)
MDAMRYRLLALDIDGTVVKEHTNMPTHQVTDAIHKVSQKVHVSLVSARAWQDQKIIVDLLGLTSSYHVIENGTKVINASGKLEYSLHISATEVQQILDMTGDWFHEVGFCIEGRWRKAYANPERDTVSTLSLISSSKSRAKEISRLLTQLPQQYSITVGAHWSKPFWAVTLISHKQASKGEGLRYIQDKLHITPDETMAVGDGASDVPMMEYATTKIAMGNAEPELRKVANYHAPPVSENGLVDVINTLIFTKAA